MDSPPIANVLPLIEERFGFLTTVFDFELVQSTEIPSMAWFKREGRLIIVSYDFIGDAAVEIDLVHANSDERYALRDVLAFEAAVQPVRREGLRERALVAAECERLATLLSDYGREFLTGDIDGYRHRFREALLVRGTRALAVREFYDGDPRRSRALFETMRAYWDERDREHVAQLESGAPLRFVRRG